LKELTIIIPCYNEQDNIHKICTKLRKLGLKDNTLFVNDGSLDMTEQFIKARNFKQIIIPTNKGIGNAINQAMFHVKTKYTAILDCDMTYKPETILKMLKKIGNADMITASPYHPEGKVKGVSKIRLLLSKTVSWFYMIKMNSNIHTWTAMVRIYKSFNIPYVENNGFISQAEIMIKMLKRGYKIKEYPTTLTTRKRGQSKMNLIKTIIEHIKLLITA